MTPQRRVRGAATSGYGGPGPSSRKGANMAFLGALRRCWRSEALTILLLQCKSEPQEESGLSEARIGPSLIIGLGHWPHQPQNKNHFSSHPGSFVNSDHPFSWIYQQLVPTSSIQEDVPSGCAVGDQNSEAKILAVREKVIKPPLLCLGIVFGRTRGVKCVRRVTSYLFRSIARLKTPAVPQSDVDEIRSNMFWAVWPSTAFLRSTCPNNVVTTVITNMSIGELRRLEAMKHGNVAKREGGKPTWTNGDFGPPTFEYDHTKPKIPLPV